MDQHTSTGLIVPDGLGRESEGRGPLGEEAQSMGYPRGRPLDGMSGVVVNETALPDDAVMQATNDHFVHNASMAWGQPTNFQLYNQRQGSLLARSEYRTPVNVIEEIRLARDLFEHDDDVASVGRELLALAFGEGMEHTHGDERSLAIFDGVAKEANLDRALKEMYREMLIASQFTTAMLFTRTELEFTPRGASQSANEMVNSPVVGVFHSEHIRVVGNDMFGTGILGYDPPEDRLRAWLDEYFSDSTTPARKAEMGREDRATANLFVGVTEIDQLAPTEDLPWSWASSGRLYLLNPTLCFRTTMPKGTWKYPKPMLTANFSLLEAKRLLNIMDYALLQGGSNFIVVAKKGTDQRPAQPAEVENLMNVVRTASKSGVIVGDHRLSFEIITPKLDELLNSDKRRLLGRKIAMRMMGIAERAEASPTQGESSDVEILSRVVMADRNEIRRHVENRIYPQVVKRNRKLLTKGPAGVWFPKIVLQGLQYFTDLVLKLRDRGDIARGTAVAAAGFDWDTEVEKRKHEVASGDDEIMQPAAVPHSSPEAGPQDNNEGRPPGSKEGRPSGDPAKPKRQITQNPGETVKAWWDEDLKEIVRVGEVTYAILEEYADTKRDGRVTALEREAIEGGEPITRGGIAVIPVNTAVTVQEELRAVRLREDGLSMIVGYRLSDGAIVAKALVYREPIYTLADAATRTARWGFGVHELPGGALPALPPGDPEENGMIPPELHIHMPNEEKGTRVILRDKDGNIIGSAPAKEPEEE